MRDSFLSYVLPTNKPSNVFIASIFVVVVLVNNVVGIFFLISIISFGSSLGFLFLCLHRLPVLSCCLPNSLEPLGINNSCFKPLVWSLQHPCFVWFWCVLYLFKCMWFWGERRKGLFACLFSLAMCCNFFLIVDCDVLGKGNYVDRSSGTRWWGVEGGRRSVTRWAVSVL